MLAINDGGILFYDPPELDVTEAGLAIDASLPRL